MAPGSQPRAWGGGWQFFATMSRPRGTAHLSSRAFSLP
jgi:hypothetical protein